MKLMAIVTTLLIIAGMVVYEHSGMAPSVPRPEILSPTTAKTASQEVKAFHQEHLCAFIRSPGNGVSRMGPGHFTNGPGSQYKLDGTVYRIKTLELIGIANHKSPVVFAQATISFMPRTNRPKTRGLTVVENQAVAMFDQGGDVFTSECGRTLTVVGSIRAQQSCLECHPGKKKGEVLGALSYTLVMEPQSTQ